LGEYFTIVHVTSAEVDTETGAPPEKSLVILKRNSTQGQLNRGNRSIEISFVGLPDATIARAMQIAELMHADTITESRPQEEQIKAASAQYTDIHFATHGRFAPDFLEGVLAVQEDPTRGEDDSPGLLDAQEIHLLQWRRGAIITLAACESALTNGSAEVYESVGGAFLLRGVVAAVVGTAWQVDAPSASLFMREFYLERSKGRSEFESFRSGVDTVRAKGWIDWAAFTLLRKHTY
jgi:CHAT domain-containing protein